MNPMDISTIRSLVIAKQVLWTEHFALRLQERNIKRSDAITCVQHGEIIEHYPDDIPFPSCLILGASVDGKPLHVVCAVNPGTSCCMITAYYPNPDEWESDNKTRKVGK